MEINRDFKEFLQLLNEHKVKYLVIGGYAVNFHGYPRYTKDIDLWIWMDRPNLEKLISAINAFGMESLQLDVTDFSASDTIIQLGYEPYRIDLLLEVDGLDFEKSFDQRQEAILDEVNINFLNINDLIEAKETAARLQDLADAEQLRKIREKKNKKK
ncbi:MAG: nucleotidyltransferase [Lewinellaceae bacterium]|nr:nucleotidyltransferase [Phaeodactylibacter sp.]MCB9039224.1 nucleotidyltransferase [Lewinellaceae bacterium]